MKAVHSIKLCRHQANLIWWQYKTPQKWSGTTINLCQAKMKFNCNGCLNVAIFGSSIFPVSSNPTARGKLIEGGYHDDCRCVTRTIECVVRSKETRPFWQKSKGPDADQNTRNDAVLTVTLDGELHLHIPGRPSLREQRQDILTPRPATIVTRTSKIEHTIS